MMNDLSPQLSWFRGHLINDILSRWLAHSQTENGLYFVHFGKTWERRDRDICTLVSQSRLLYNFSVGYRLTGQSEYLEAVNHGADALMRYFLDSECGGWCLSCNLNGETLDFQKDLYGHAFVIFGLAHAAEVTEREDLKQAAFETWELVRSHFRDSNGGFAGKLTREFAPAPHTPSQNPVMHLFEAMMTLNTLDDSRRVRQDVEDVADFILNRLRRQKDGILPELFDANWRELSKSDGGRVDVGHAFEWAYLLSHAVELGWPCDYLNAAERFLEYGGLALGFDATDGGIISPVKPDGTYIFPRKGWWEQCEAIRALLHFKIARNNARASEPLKKVIAFAQEHFVDEENGGWFMSPPVATSENPRFDKGSEWKVDYHVVGMCVEAIRLVS
jgi:mannose-6-phosphate isomerase